MNRRLTLKGEHLSELSSDELSAVNGGTLSVDVCVALTGLTCDRLTITCLTGYYPTINAPCFTTTS